MDWNIFAWISSALFFICFLPQLYRTVRLKEVDQISPASWLLLGAAYLNGLIFSIGTEQMALTANYGPGFIITLTFLFCYYKYRKPGKK